jgi:ribosomal protein L30/L7E
MIVIIRITGQVNLSQRTKQFLDTLGLKKKFSCILLDEENPLLGKIKDYIAYGEFDEKLLDKLKKRNKGKYFALHPPIGGLKKSSKLAWPRGILGHNKDINKLLERML